MATTIRKKLKPRRVRLWTYDEMAAKLPETNQPIELWDGELCIYHAPPPSHQTTVGQIVFRLHDFAKARNLGKVYHSPIDVVLSQTRVVQPDVVFVSNEKKKILGKVIRGVPDLAVEIISTGSWRRDTIDKRALYEQFGVQEYWIVDPEAATVEVLTLKDDAFQLFGRFGKTQLARSALLKGFKIRVADILE
jgi:Uma2 family endonuclease